MLKILLLLISSFTAIPMFIHLSKIEKKETRSMLNYSNQYLELVPKELLNKDSTTVELNLSNNNIKTIPKELAGYQVLEVLNLKGNKQLEIDESFKDLAKIKTLKEIDLSECELAYLPFTINEISNLEVLNLSNNHLFEVPDMMHKMHELRIVDLSGNDIKELGYAPSLWKKLEIINLKNNPKLNVEHAFKSLSYLKKLERVEVNNLEVLPESTSLLKAKEIVFEECSFKKTAIDFTGNSRLTSIVFDNCKETKFEKVLPVIATNKQLTELTLANSGLEELSIDSIQFPKLERLDISGNDINERDLIELEKQFPNCIIETGIASKSHNVPETREIKAPFKNVIVEPEVFSIKPDQEQVLTTSNSKITIPKNAFLDKDGKLITTPVSIKYKEILNPVDQILSGIPMEYDSAGVTYNFESAGMIDFRAESNGKEVFPNPDAFINVELKSEYTDTDYGLYSMNDETGKWGYAKPAEQKRVQPDSTSNTIQPSQISPNNNRFNYPIFRGRVKPRIGYNKLKFNFDNKSKYRLLIGQRNNGYTHTLKNTSLNFIKKTRLIIEDKDWKKYKKDYKNFYKNNNYAHKIDSTDLLNNICFGYDFIVNKEKDIFEITINYIDTSLTLPCRLRKRGNPLSEQKANLKFWQKLQNEKNKESKSNEKVIKNYSNAMIAYEEELKEFQKELRAYMEENKERLKAEDKVSYVLQLNAFNIWNCDRFKRNVRGQKIKATFKNIGNKVFVPVAIYIINKTKNGYEKKLNADSFTYEENCKHSLLLLDKDGNMGVVNEASFSKAVNKIGVKKSFETELIAEDEIDRDQLLAKLI